MWITKLKIDNMRYMIATAIIPPCGGIKAKALKQCPNLTAKRP